MSIPLKALVIEDEELSMERLVSILADFQSIEVIGTARSGTDAVAMIDSLKPDLIFLDIELPGDNGFEVLKKVRYSPKVVFVTAYDHYAVEAFEENCIDYILKPFSRERLQKTIDKIQRTDTISNASLLQAINGMIERQKKKNHFAIKDGDDILIIPADDVYYFMAEEKYVFLCTYDREYYYNMTLRELEEILDADRFCRIHKSFIISIDKIQKLHKLFINEYRVILKDKKETPIKVSRNYLPLLKKQLHISEIG